MNMIFLQASEYVTRDMLSDLLSKAFEASPYNALGYGIALVMSLMLNAVCIYTITRMYRDAKLRDEALDKFSADIIKTLIELKLRLDDTRNLRDDIVRVIRENIQK